MKAFPIALCLWCLIFWPQLFHAAPSQSYVVGWGSNQGGQATGIPSIRFTNGMFLMNDNPSATGAVVIAGQVLSDAVAVSAGGSHSLALKSDGTVVGWGGNGTAGVLGYPSPYPGRTNGIVRINGQILSNVVSIVAGRGYSLALKRDGMMITWGENYLPAGLTNVAAMAVEWGANWVLKNDGTVFGWEGPPITHQYNQLPTPEDLTNVVAIAVGPGGHNTRGVALRKGGTVGIWGGETLYNDATPPADLSNVVAVAAGSSHTLALKSDGTIIGWGFNNVGQATGIPTTNAPNISAGQVAIAGKVLSNVVSVAASRECSIALKNDGTVIAWGRIGNDHAANVPAGLSNVVAIAAGDNFCLAITTNRAVADKFLKGVNSKH